MNVLSRFDQFEKRHLGIDESALKLMLEKLGVSHIDQLMDETVPSNIRLQSELDIAEARSEYDFLNDLKVIANKNKVYKSFIGQGYNNTITPNVILRNIFQNPGWYTQYTPYQAEISQGRLEALLNFQTLVSDLTGFPIANASLLDEGTAAAEAMAMFYHLKNKRRKTNPAETFLVSSNIYAQTKDVLITRATPLGIKIKEIDFDAAHLEDDVFGVMLQYPGADGKVEDPSSFIEACKQKEIFVCVAADILSLSLLKSPAELGADVAVGNTQRLGVPMGYGGPHAAYFATKQDYKRIIPGRIIGVSKDRLGNRTLRMALQTREQHIRREKATSNICTAQALLAIIAGMYGVYHGPEGLKAIATRVHNMTQILANGFTGLGLTLKSDQFFDTISIVADENHRALIKEKSEANKINFFYTSDAIQISLDETTTEEDLAAIFSVFTEDKKLEITLPNVNALPASLNRTEPYLDHPVFQKYRSETEMMRYIKSLENKDLSLMHSMIPLGSCTMKLNAATQLMPVSWPEFANLHPFVPANQAKGYAQIFEELEADLCEITGFQKCSLQPNSGAQGEYAGLLTIKAYHEDRGDHHRNIALIPSSAHGTNPASAVMAGMKVVVTKCDEDGNILVEDLKAKAEEHKDNLAALMVTYPSTHGVFETAIQEICDLVHENGGMVYMDGANMNAQVGYTNPALIHADVCHLNLHKTFSIPHGGGGPGMGPICVNDKLAPFLPGHALIDIPGNQKSNAVSSAPWGSASILLISYAYIKMLGRTGVKKSTAYAILNANYIKECLADHYPVLYTGKNGRVAHELILDLRQFKSIGISAEDVAKRLIDYGFHAPTLSFPVAGTIMIEPTESEAKEEIDKFCEAMIEIKKEIDEVANGTADPENNVLVNAPHPMHQLTSDEWTYPYSRQKAAFPLEYLNTNHKFWVSVARVDNAFGDRNLICTCPPLEAYEEAEMN